MEKFSILLVDDVAENIHSLKMMIEDSFDVEIFSALSAQEGMEILMKEDINLILTDIQMPEIDGFEFAEYLKSIEKTKDIPLIFITGIYDKDEYKRRGYDIGAIEYITKPIDDVLLDAKLKVYIDIFERSKKRQDEIEEKNEILIHQAKMATMGEMIGVIAHQLKQPLNILSLYCNDVKDTYKLGEIDDEFIDDFSKKTKDNIAFMSQTIDGFRDFFNPKKPKKKFLLKKVIDNSIELLLKQLEKNNVNLHVDIAEEEIYGVDSELEQVILNLLTNAQDAFIERKVENRDIYVTAGTNKKYTVVVIEDTAGGIKEDNIEKIFDPYFTTKEKGTGTGLYMVKLVVKTSFNGELKLENSQRGAKFILILPNGN
ncbi:hybrid sensor histidine kinase/response regulator [Malaciobacter halophilus]|uniref:histidine kinase n=1 Tax=Malaciobacter halophilus TaxID=197482 RepID=A0A2N1J103_9BACT|nr:hybrid sensor histidine kinase/response regulator [Malaciobacter halophilus]AXH09463.1 two-component system sensor histidine kinase/response regulator fusion protein [Malaciobacter halophilus]PKI80226.1 hybrid sensor histidine kinase/response regulator [Malaciobacter halophilus]